MPNLLTIEEIKNKVESITGYQLLSTQYNKNQKINILCPNNHIFSMLFNNFQHGQRCKICKGIKNYTNQEKYDLFKQYNYIVLKQKSTNIFEIKCPNGHIFNSYYSNFKKGHRCPKCANVAKYSVNEISEMAKKDGFEFIGPYKNSRTPTLFKCSNNHLFKMRIYRWKKSKYKCPHCFGNAKLTYSFVKKEIENEEYKLLSKEYKNLITPLRIKHNKCGHIFEINFNNWQNFCRCPLCTKKYRSNIEEQIFSFVTSIYNKKIINNDRTNIINPKTGRYLELDIWLPDINKAIEVNGIYWHQKQKALYNDSIKVNFCKSNKIDLLTVTDVEFVNNKNIVFDKIKTFINMDRL